MKKILFVITQSEIGGAQQDILQMLLKLPSDRYEIGLAAAAHPGDLFEAVRHFKVKIFPLQFLQREINFKKDRKAFQELRDLFRIWKPDIVQLQSSKAGFLGALAGRTLAGGALARQFQKRPKIIYRIGGFSFFENIPFWKKAVYFLAEWISAFWKDVIIVNNVVDFNVSKKWKIGAGKTIYIPNGLSPALPFLDAVEARRQLDLPEKKYQLVAIANFYKNKDLRTLLQATVWLKAFSLPFHLSIFGDGNERLSLEDWIKSLALEKDVSLLGFKKNAAQYLKAFDVLVLSSIKEGMPWVILEAFAAEIPVVATEVGGVPTMIEHRKEGLLVPPQNPEAMAKAIRECLLERELKQLLIRHAKERLHRDFSLDQMAQKTMALYA